MGSVSGFAGGFAVVIRPPASRRMQIPAATSLEDCYFHWTAINRGGERIVVYGEVMG